MMVIREQSYGKGSIKIIAREWIKVSINKWPYWLAPEHSKRSLVYHHTFSPTNLRRGMTHAEFRSIKIAREWIKVPIRISDHTDLRVNTPKEVWCTIILFLPQNAKNKNSERVIISISRDPVDNHIHPNQNQTHSIQTKNHHAWYW